MTQPRAAPITPPAANRKGNGLLVNMGRLLIRAMHAPANAPETVQIISAKPASPVPPPPI
jgi:hypothetical protein